MRTNFFTSLEICLLVLDKEKSVDIKFIAYSKQKRLNIKM